MPVTTLLIHFFVVLLVNFTLFLKFVSTTEDFTLVKRFIFDGLEFVPGPFDLDNNNAYMFDAEGWMHTFPLETPSDTDGEDGVATKLVLEKEGKKIFKGSMVAVKVCKDETATHVFLASHNRDCSGYQLKHLSYPDDPQEEQGKGEEDSNDIKEISVADEGYDGEVMATSFEFSVTSNNYPFLMDAKQGLFVTLSQRDNVHLLRINNSTLEIEDSIEEHYKVSIERLITFKSPHLAHLNSYYVQWFATSSTYEDQNFTFVAIADQSEEDTCAHFFRLKHETEQDNASDGEMAFINLGSLKVSTHPVYKLVISKPSIIYTNVKKETVEIASTTEDEQANENNSGEEEEEEWIEISLEEAKEESDIDCKVDACSDSNKSQEEEPSYNQHKKIITFFCAIELHSSIRVYQLIFVDDRLQESILVYSEDIIQGIHKLVFSCNTLFVVTDDVPFNGSSAIIAIDMNSVNIESKIVFIGIHKDSWDPNTLGISPDGSKMVINYGNELQVFAIKVQDKQSSSYTQTTRISLSVLD